MSNDEKILEALRSQKNSLTPVQLAELLNDLAENGLTHRSFIMYFKRAFPDIPMRILTVAGGWSRISGGDLSDNDINEMLCSWLDGMNKNEIIKNICYTELVYGRINKKLNTNYSNSEIEELILDLLINTSEIDYSKIGKNYYIANISRNIRVTVNSNTFRVITVDRLKRKLRNDFQTAYSKKYAVTFHSTKMSAKYTNQIKEIKCVHSTLL